MTVPKKLRLGPYRYSVVVDRAAFDRVQVSDGQHLCGRQKLTEQTIWLNPEMGPDATADTLIHECLHHFFRVSAVNSMEEGDEEQLVNFLAPNILALLRDNPALVAYLCE